MAKILIIDDDAALELLAENLRFRGHEVERISSTAQALDSLDKVLSNNIVILDILMNVPENKKEQLTSGIRTAGMLIYKNIRSHNEKLPVIVYSGCNDVDIVEIIDADQYSTFLAKWHMPSIAEIANIVENKLGLKTSLPTPNIFIVHGHNDTLKLKLKNYLQNTLGFPEPIILHEQSNMGRTIIEKFEDYAYSSNLVFVLLTPDDKIADFSNSNNEKRRARQNVILELGFFLGTLGRESGRVILLHVGPLELPNDLSGVCYIDISNGIESAGEDIRKELKYVNEKSELW